MRCLKEEQALMEAERRADSKLLALVPVLGVDGVREQIGHMREALRDDRESLYILFEQIIRKPDEVCRDIGRHVGGRGREVLIALIVHHSCL